MSRDYSFSFGCMRAQIYCQATYLDYGNTGPNLPLIPKIEAKNGASTGLWSLHLFKTKLISYPEFLWGLHSHREVKKTTFHHLLEAKPSS
jgi:hypothetical protein